MAPPGKLAAGCRPLGLVLALTLVASVGVASAMQIDGRLSSASFIYETFGPDQVKEWDLINRLALNVRDFGHPAVSLHWQGSHRGEVLEAGIDKSRARTYHGYLRAAPWDGLSFSIGRQWVHAGVGSARLDGARLSVDHPEYGKLSLFGGTRGFLDPLSDSVEGLDAEAFDASGIWGAQLSSRTLPGDWSFALSAARLFKGGSEEGNRLGVSLSWRPRPSSLLRYEHRYELGAEETYFQHLRLFHNLSEGSVSLAWNRRQSYPPSAEDSYILRKFGNEPWFTHSFEQKTDELRAHITRPCMLIEGWTTSLQVLEIFPEDEDRGDGLSLGLSRPGIAFGYRLQRGFGGDQDGLWAEARYEFRDRTWVWLELNKVYYKYGEDDDFDDEYVTDDEALATRIGVDALLGDLDATIAVEALNNVRAKSQVRFLARLGYRFSHATQNGGE